MDIFELMEMMDNGMAIAKDFVERMEEMKFEDDFAMCIFCTCLDMYFKDKSVEVAKKMIPYMEQVNAEIGFCE